MKLDLSGLESATLYQLSNVFSPSPSFKIPNDADYDGFQKEAMQMVKPAKGTTTFNIYSAPKIEHILLEYKSKTHSAYIISIYTQLKNSMISITRGIRAQIMVFVHFQWS